MVVIGRILVILVGFFAASLAAGIVLVTALIYPAWEVGRLGVDDTSFAVIATISFVLVGSFGFLPALMIALVTEAFNVRSVLAYATGGAVLGALSYLAMARFEEDDVAAFGDISHEVEVMMAAGIAAGLVYWLIAGRTAGLWRKALPPMRR